MYNDHVIKTNSWNDFFLVTRRLLGTPFDASSSGPEDMARQFRGWQEVVHVSPEMAVAHIKTPSHIVSGTGKLPVPFNFYEFHVCLHGKGSGTLDNKELSIHEGKVNLVDPSLPFSFTASDDFELCIIQISKALIHSKVGDISGYIGKTISSQTPYSRLLATFCQNSMAVIFEEKDQDLVASIGRAMFELLIGTLNQVVSVGELPQFTRAMILKSALNYIDEHLSENSLTPQKIADELKISVGYLHRIFKSHGKTVSKAIWDRRLIRVHQILESNDSRSLSEIAFGSGFSRLSHFSRLFKSHYGVSPKEFRIVCRWLNQKSRTFEL